MHWHELLPGAVFLMTFIASLFSGMAGGGGGFIINPFLIAIGLTPQQTIATAKFGSFGLIGGSVIAFRERLLDNRRLTALILVIAGAAGIASSLMIKHIDNQSLQRLMGALTLVMVPIMLKKTKAGGRHSPGYPSRVFGTIFLAAILLLQGILSGGIGALVSVIYIVFFGTTALEANVLKRKSSLILNIVVVGSLLTSGFINYTYGLFGMAGGILGGYTGSHIAIQKGESFPQYLLVIFMVVSGIWLLTSA